MYGFEMLSYNIKDGFLEAVVRGHRSGLLSVGDYNNLSQCETLEDIKLNLTSSDYGSYLANEASPIYTATIVEKCTQKMVNDWNYMRTQADENLAQFMDYCTYGHMIDNVVLIVTGTLHERDVQQCLRALTSVAGDCAGGRRAGGVSEGERRVAAIQRATRSSGAVVAELQVLFEGRMWMEPLVSDCLSVMGERLVEVVAALKQEGQAQAGQPGGDLTALPLELLARLAKALCLLPTQLGYGESAMLDKLLYEEEVKKCVDCYEQQFHYAVFYAYMKLREQEIRNIMWVSECVAQDQKGRIVDGIVYLF
ncbi:putative V-type proton ATPase subunit d [Tetrabaena socialis]|uniref:Putative V-type proton ATPase subunit d n=1 Tax=Tetrabaena socialis TaxID=47790 RepID=A0A2J8AAH2_9CHLO|nr:putative V-type proton ATPase subunit d [Tetrabaena socialis]|eukprot:PNH09530.1 putative V-type proton ATPase subunit d [Tetrabaena socialis]